MSNMAHTGTVIPHSLTEIMNGICDQAGWIMGDPIVSVMCDNDDSDSKNIIFGGTGKSRFIKYEEPK